MNKAQLTEELKTAMKSGDKLRLSVIRNIQSQLKYKEIEGRGAAGAPAPAEEEVFLAVVKSLVKQRRDSIEQFTAGNRPDLVEQESNELKVLESFLPAQMGQAEIEAVVAQVITETGASSAKDMGAVMKAVLAKLAGRADGKLVSDAVKSKLK